MSSSLLLPFNLRLRNRPYSPCQPTVSFFSNSKTSVQLLAFKSLICYASNNPYNYEREEVRWLREEQRWIREEQRWLREEQRWTGERESLLRKIADLKLRIQALERQNSVQVGPDSGSESISNIAGLLQLLKEKNRIAESGSVASSMVLEERSDEEVVEKEVVVEEVVRVSEGILKETVKEWTTLRKGSEGEEVRAMQEALQKLGFYSGEEDMEFSSFSSGTERAVKTWQASLGAPEDGIMTSELLERLYIEERDEGAGLNIITNQKGSTSTTVTKQGADGTAISSVTGSLEVRRTVVKEEGDTEVKASEHRVFLLGENRWEDSSRLAGNNRKVVGGNSKDTATKCLTCRGEGRLLCTECDGTGEPNIEPQFMELLEEETKCPYCDGLGYTICDVCDGKTLVSV